MKRFNKKPGVERDYQQSHWEMKMPKILIVDDEWITRLEIEEMLADLGYEVAGRKMVEAEIEKVS